ncbi:hypothetical protein [Limnoraphis robusta]|uniref:hypothetical protein n=1 Tax=Limnoraphis robusta TaxID=1118279 RepID=UPI000A60DCD8|nr:hypothetical protein [Limnoraphis robusta]
MKCINCNTNNTYRERTTSGLSRCKKCRHQFVFDYRRHSKCPQKLTDTFFLNAIDRISANKTLYFTAKHFKYFLSRKLAQSPFVGGIQPQPTVKHIKVFMIEDVNSFLAQKNAIGVYLGLNLLAEVILWTVFKKLTLISIFTNYWTIGSFWLVFLISNAIILPIFHSDFLNTPKEHRYHRQLRKKRTVFFSNLTILTIGTLMMRGYLYYQDPIYNLLLSFEEKSIFPWIIISLLAAPLLLARTMLTNFSVYLADLKEGKRGEVRTTRQINNYENTAVQNYFDIWIQEWERINGKIVKLLPPPEYKIEVSINSDVSTYSFDRLIVCESADIAQFLIANNFHFEKNCAILSIDGYPQNIFNTVMQMLRRNPNLWVYAVHDCTPKGVSIVHQLRTSDQWFRDSNVTMIDIGILPRQILAVKGKSIWVKMTEKSAQQAEQLPLEIQQSLGEDELKWLTEVNFVELESIHPQKLIHILSQSLANQALNFDAPSLRETDDSILEETDYSLSEETDRKNNIRYQSSDTFG